MGWCRRTFRAPAEWYGRRVVIRFEAVNYRAKVWLNGKLVAENHDAFLPFECDASDTIHSEGVNVLVVQAGNQHHDDDVPGRHVQGRGYGGILREVTLYSADSTFLGEVCVVATLAKGEGSVEVRVDAGGELVSGVEVTAEVREPDGCILASIEPVSLKADGRAALSCEVGDPSLWSPDSPALYTVVTTLRTDCFVRDAVEKHFGFRSIEATPHGLLLNGSPVFLTGFNRHEDSPRTDMVSDPEAARQDLERMKEAGANFARLCHYPHHPVDLDICDELGLMVMDEIPLNLEVDPARAASAERQLERMIRRDRHHPCVIDQELAGLTQPYLCGTTIWRWADHPWPPPQSPDGLHSGMNTRPVAFSLPQTGPAPWVGRPMPRSGSNPHPRRDFSPENH